MLISTAVAALRGISALNKAREVLSSESRLSIIGDGAAGLAAGYLLVGEVDKLRIFASDPQAVNIKYENLPDSIALIKSGEIEAHTLLSAAFAPASTNIRDAVKGASGLVITCPVTEYGAVIEKLKSNFTAGQSILLLNAPLGAGLQFSEELRKAKLEIQLNILELGPLFEKAVLEGKCLRIYGARKKVSVCGNSRNETRRALTTTTGLSKALVPSSNLLDRGLGEVERVIRPVLILFGLLGGRSRDISDLAQIVNPQLTAIMRGLETEVRELYRAYGLSGRNFLETLTDLSVVDWHGVDCLDQALIAIGPSLLSQSAVAFNHLDPVNSATEVLKRDVTETLMLLTEFARVARVQMPVLDSIIAMAGVATRSDFTKSGRTMADLGLFGLDAHEIMELINS